MNEKNEVDKVDDVMLPGFRFHPTDEELVGYYLKRKIQEQSLPIELIKQVDIYKYNPWDLPKLACTGEKEWYFYCPRDRKYRNSARPNRVTGAGFWKATGTDRPIYSSDGSKCIGLKKSLVFYTGRAAKGIKTNWMMHEFRLPPLYHSAHPKKALDKTLPPNDSWAICRIFKKANTMAQRAISHSWVSPSPITMEESNIFSEDAFCTHLSPENISCTAENRSPVSCVPKYATASYKSAELPFPNGDIPSSAYEMLAPPKISVDVSSMLLWDGKISDGTDFEEPQQRFNGYSINLLQGMQGNMETKGNEASLRNDPSANPAYSNIQWESNVRSIGFPFALPSSAPEARKPNLPWESSSTSPSEMSSSTSNSTRKGFTWCSR